MKDDKKNNLKDINISKEQFEFAQLDVSLHDTKFDTKPVSYLKDAMRRFAKNKSSVVATVIIIILLLFAIIGVEISPYRVTFQNNHCTNYLPKVKGLEWMGFDGSKKETISAADYWFYMAIAEETGDNPIKKIYKEYDVEVQTGTLTTIKHFYDVELDSYYKPGNKFLTLTEKEYRDLQKYQDEHNVQIIYPAFAVKNISDGSTLDQYEANYWYTRYEYGPDKGLPEGISPDKQRVEWINKYVDFSGFKEDGTTPYDGYTSKMRVEGEGNHFYDYAIRKQNKQYYVRVNYFRYFEFQNGHQPIFWFGTNQYGQDIFVRLAAGARFSFLLALCVSIVNMLIGAIYGAIEGYYGGKIDISMERLVEILGGIPFIVVVTLFNLHLASKVGVLASLVFAFIATGWIGMAARVRMQFYRFKNQEYILAARTLGANDGRLMFKHIFPNAIGTIITGSVLAIPGVIFSESTLSYLGIINLESSKITSVGTLLSNGQGVISTFPHIILFPAIFISLLMISFNLFGNGLRDAFNPSLRGSED